jgi:hypothetical protein
MSTFARILAAAVLTVMTADLLAADSAAPIALPDHAFNASRSGTAFALEAGSGKYAGWLPGDVTTRDYFDELLPALFERTMAVNRLDDGVELLWVFTGPQGGFTIGIAPHRVTLTRRYYDSPGFAELAARPARHPELVSPPLTVPYTGRLRSVAVALDHRLNLILSLNGREVARESWLLDVHRHQLRLLGPGGGAAGIMFRPDAVAAAVRVNPAERHQRMIGFGGIATPTAYAMLSPEGRRRWWRLVVEYNLLIQREYPMGQRLRPAMDNWDRLADATPDYYADNFPNGEVSDFNYLRHVRRLGGKVWFEFWDLPPWVGDAPEKYAQAIVRYCQTAKEKAGAPPDVVGIQNEKPQPPEQWRRMTLALRRALDAAGFRDVRIHMSDAGYLARRGKVACGIERAEIFRQWPDVWAAIDYAATHIYDYQDYFTKPDEFDGRLVQWRRLIGDKPFLSTELCVSDSRYQTPSYRVALAMGQLYHKNLVLTDAVAICYCWTLLNIEQPSYGWTRTLFVPDMEDGGLPTASSHQLRVFGAYSRRIGEGMTRVGASADNSDLLASAFADDGRRTLVLVNRGVRPCHVTVDWPDTQFTERETASPYQPNTIAAAPRSMGVATLDIGPGAIATLSNVPLGRCPKAFEP